MKAKKATAAIGTAAGITLILGIFATNDIVTTLNTKPTDTPSASASATPTSKPVETPSAAPTVTLSATATPSETPKAEAPATEEPQAAAGPEESSEPLANSAIPVPQAPVSVPQAVAPYVPQAPIAPVNVPQVPVAPQVPVIPTQPACVSWNGHSCEPDNVGPHTCPAGQTWSEDFKECGKLWVNPNPGKIYVNPNPGTPTGTAATPGPTPTSK